jgi:hypothetical protein
MKSRPKYFWPKWSFTKNLHQQDEHGHEGWLGQVDGVQVGRFHQALFI